MRILEPTGYWHSVTVTIATRSCDQGLGNFRWQLSSLIGRSVPQAVQDFQRPDAISGRDCVFGPSEQRLRST